MKKENKNMKRILFILVSTLLCITSFAQIGYKTKECFVEFTADDTNCVFKLQKELTTKQKMKLKTQVSFNDNDSLSDYVML